MTKYTDFFPYDDLRQGQTDLMEDIHKAIQNKQHILAHAPTGLGKTVAALTPAVHEAMRTGKKVIFLTNRHSQHKIAVDTVQDITDKTGKTITVIDLIGKQKMCLRDEADDLDGNQFTDFCNLEVKTNECKFYKNLKKHKINGLLGKANHVEDLIKYGKQHQVCPYFLAGKLSEHSQVIIADYNHIFSNAAQGSAERFKIDIANSIIIVDEAHNLIDRIRDNYSYSISEQLLDACQEEIQGTGKKEAMLTLQNLTKTITQLLTDKKQQLRNPNMDDSGKTKIVEITREELNDTFTEQYQQQHGIPYTLTEAADELRILAKLLHKDEEETPASERLADALDNWNNYKTGAWRYLQHNTETEKTHIYVKLLDASIPVKHIIQNTPTIIMMSGTLHPPTQTRDLLDIPITRCQVKTYKSPFPPENRPIIIDTQFDLRYKNRTDQLWYDLSDKINQTQGQIKGNIAIYTPSYKILKEILDNLSTNKRIFVEQSNMSKADRDYTLNELRHAKDNGNGAVLLGVMGGSFSEGVDFKDNLLDLIIIAGVPLAPPSDTVEQTIDYLEKKLPGKGKHYAYNIPAFNKIHQTMGRGIRSETDKCAVILMDTRFSWSTYKKLLPNDPKPVITQNPLKALKNFLGSKNNVVVRTNTQQSTLDI